MLKSELYHWTVRCKKCLHCKTRVFSNYQLFLEWLESFEVNGRQAWKRKFKDDCSRKVPVYWCGKKPGKRNVVVTPPGPGLRDKETCWYFEDWED